MSPTRTPSPSQSYHSCRWQRPLVLFYISTKYHQNIVKGIQVTEQTQNLFQTEEGEISPKVRKPELSFLYASCHLVLFSHFYKVSSKYSSGYSFTEQTRNQIQTQEGELIPKVRKPKLSFLYVTRPLVLFYISTKNYKNILTGIWVTEQTLNQCIIIVKYNKGR